MSSYIYIAPLEDRTALKIGKTNNPVERINTLTKYYDFSLVDIQVIDCMTEKQAFQTESLLHHLFKDSNLFLEGDGGTEFFDYNIKDDLFYIIDILVRRDGFSFVHGFEYTKEDYLPRPVAITSSNISEAIEDKRLALGFKQTDLAKACGISVPTLKKITSGNLSVSFELVLKVLHQLGIDISIPYSEFHRTGKQRVR